jgi:hypothetical protein
MTKLTSAISRQKYTFAAIDGLDAQRPFFAYHCNGHAPIRQDNTVNYFRRYGGGHYLGSLLGIFHF